MSNFFKYYQDTAVLPAYSFILRVEAAIDVPCRAVRNLRRENEFDYIQEGGLNDYVHLRRKPISKPFSFQVERYAGTDYVDPLTLGTELALPVLLFVYDRPGQVVNVHRTYTFTGCTVTAKDYGELNAEKSGLLVETTTIAFQEMICVDTPWIENLNNMGRACMAMGNWTDQGRGKFYADNGETDPAKWR